MLKNALSVLAFLGIISGYWRPEHDGLEVVFRWSTMGFLVWILISLWISILVHELGHVALGKWRGMQVEYFHVRPITFFLQQGNWFAYWDMRKEHPLGLASCNPQRPQSVKSDLVWFSFGGPSAGAGLSLALYLLMPWVADPWPPVASQAIPFMVMVLSALLAGLSLLPEFGEVKFPSDGTVIFELLSGHSNGKAVQASHRLRIANQSELGLRDTEFELIRTLRRGRREWMHEEAVYWEIQWEWQRLRLDRALELSTAWVARWKDISSENQEIAAFLHMVHQAFICRDALEANKWLAKANVSSDAPHMQQLCAAYIGLAEGDRVKCLKALDLVESLRACTGEGGDPQLASDLNRIRSAAQEL